jgi:sphingomyelin phosphodiesterase acid-like 3
MVAKRCPLIFLVVFVLLCSPAQSRSGPPSQKILIASDLHFNPFADPALVKDLAAAPPGRWERILNRSQLPAYSPYGQDTNWWLLQSALDAMRATEPNPALVMITGDLLAHGFPAAYAKAVQDSNRKHYRAFVFKTVAFLALELGKRFGQSQILLTPGNNDNECGDYDIQADGPFLKDTSKLARKLARAGGRFNRDWKALGSYTVQPRAIRGVRILSVNSVFFSNKYQAASFADGCTQVDSAAASRTFTWLESNLAQAARANEKVWLMLHIPPGIDGYATMMQYRRAAAGTEDLCRKAIVPIWKPVWTTLFERVTADYQSTITATFAGHTHTDDFRLIPDRGTGGQFVLIDPPISPIYGQNPAFRVVSFRNDAGLADQSTYYLTNLQAARSDVPGTWGREYSFLEAWQTHSQTSSQTPSLDRSSLNSIYDRIKSDPQARAQWLNFLDVSSSHDPVPANGVQTLDCAIANLDLAGYEACYCPAP